MEARSRVHGDLQHQIVYRATGDLKLSKRRFRKHPKKQIEVLAAAMRQFGFNNPIGIDAEDCVVVGNGRLKAAKLIGLREVPTLRLDHLTEAERRAYAISENKLAELGGWDIDELSIELRELSTFDLDFPMELTGFDGFELDTLLDGPAYDDDGDIPAPDQSPVSREGDLWVMSGHRLICGDARDEGIYPKLMQGDLARTSIMDPPYNVPIEGNVGGRGVVKPRDFVMGVGEWSTADFTAFLVQTMGHAAAYSVDGSIHFAFMDWRSSSEIQSAGRQAFGDLKNVAVWVKDNAGLGKFYRSQHEFCFIFKKGTAPHFTTFGVGGDGRFRTNVWNYPGVNGYGPGRKEALAMHPTVKPVAMLADAIRDVTHRGDIVLDPFAGSGSTLIAAAKTSRRARLIEIDPLYCDGICQRWKLHAGDQAILTQTGESFDVVQKRRLKEQCA